MGVNYFGHAVVASWQGLDDDRELGAVALGAMLPDFASMSGARLAGADHHAIARGIALHHATDGVFHHAPAVLGLFRDVAGRLTARGCRRGPTRAAAHVGVELLLDGILLDEPRHRDAYLAALAVDPAPVTWKHDGDADRFGWLHQRLREHGVPDDLRRPASVAARLFRVLAGRRLLAPTGDEQATIARVLAEVAPRVAVAADTVLQQVAAGLAIDRP